MTEKTQPTDAEIMDMAAKHQLKAYAQFAGAGDVWIEGEVAFARAVLAKWGTSKTHHEVYYADLPYPTVSFGVDDAWNESAMRDFADRTYSLRTSHRKGDSK